MEMASRCIEQVDHLSMRQLTPSQPDEHRGDVLMLGNAYGIMDYQLPLAEALAERGFRTWWFPFSGQEDTPGNYSIPSGAKDVATAVAHLDSESDGPIFLVAHCAGSLMAIEYLKATPDSPIKKMAVYGLLFNPARRRSQAEPRLEKHGVRTALTDEMWNYNPLSALAKIQTPVLFCHATDPLNRARATDEEMERAVETAPQADISWFDGGYDNDQSVIPEYANRYCSWFIS